MRGGTSFEGRDHTEQQANLIETPLATRTDLDRLEDGLTIRVGGMIMAPGGVLVAVKVFGR